MEIPFHRVTMRYMAPELLRYNPDLDENPRATIASDMYALGVVMWEVKLRRLPRTAY